MSEEFPLSDYYETPEPSEYRQPVWTPKKASEPKPVTEDPAPAGSCEFVGSLIYEGSAGRKCTCDGLYCPASVFMDSKVYTACHTRLEKLKEKT